MEVDISSKQNTLFIIICYMEYFCKIFSLQLHDYNVEEREENGEGDNFFSC